MSTALSLTGSRFVLNRRGAPQSSTSVSQYKKHSLSLSPEFTASLIYIFLLEVEGINSKTICVTNIAIHTLLLIQMVPCICHGY